MFSRAIGELCAYGGPQPGRAALVDIYARNKKDGTIRGDATAAETHTVLLYVRPDSRIALLDPSNDDFSGFVRPLLSEICVQHTTPNVIQVATPGGALFRGNLRGGDVATADRDCVSIALAAANMISRNPNTEERHLYLLTNTPDVVAGSGVALTKKVRGASQREIENTVYADQYVASFRRNASTDPVERSYGGVGPWIEANIRALGNILPAGRVETLASTAAELSNPPRHTPEQLSLLKLLEPGPGDSDQKNMTREIRRVVGARIQASNGAEGSDILHDPAHHQQDLSARLTEVKTAYQAQAIGLGVQHLVAHPPVSVQVAIRPRSSSVGALPRDKSLF